MLLLANLANWVTLGWIISVLLLAFPGGGGLVGEVRIGRAAAGICHGG